MKEIFPTFEPFTCFMKSALLRTKGAFSLPIMFYMHLPYCNCWPFCNREWLERHSTDSAYKRDFFLFTSDKYNFVSLRLTLEEASEGGMVNFIYQLDWAMGYPGIW